MFTEMLRPELAVSNAESCLEQSVCSSGVCTPVADGAICASSGTWHTWETAISLCFSLGASSIACCHNAHVSGLACLHCVTCFASFQRSLPLPSKPLNTHQTDACCCMTHQLQECVAAADCGNSYVCNAAGNCALPLYPGSSCSQDGEACTWQCIAVWLVLHVWHFTSQSICNTLQNGLFKCWMLYAEA